MRLPINNIDEDPWLRNWIFVGPFDEYELAQEVSILCMEVALKMDKRIFIKKWTRKILPFHQNLQLGKHAIHQYFPKSHGKLCNWILLIQSKEN